MSLQRCICARVVRLHCGRRPNEPATLAMPPTPIEASGRPRTPTLGRRLVGHISIYHRSHQLSKCLCFTRRSVTASALLSTTQGRRLRTARCCQTPAPLILPPCCSFCYLVFLYDTRLICLSRNPLLVVVDGAVEVFDGAVIAHPQGCAYVLEHRDVVADHEHTTLEYLQRR